MDACSGPESSASLLSKKPQGPAAAVADSLARTLRANHKTMELARHNLRDAYGALREAERALETSLTTRSLMRALVAAQRKASEA